VVLAFGIFLGVWIPRMEMPAPLATTLAALGIRSAEQQPVVRERILPLVTSLPIGPGDSCMLVTRTEVEEGYAKRHKFDLKLLADSMRKHTDKETGTVLRGLSVLGLGKPLCMMLVRREKDNVPMLMYNVNITGQSKETTSVAERSSFCPGNAPRYIMRHREILVEYMSETGVTMEYVSFALRDAALIQQLWANEHGQTNCA